MSECGITWKGKYLYQNGTVLGDLGKKKKNLFKDKVALYSFHNPESYIYVTVFLLLFFID